MNTIEARELFDYGEWANGRMFDALREVDAEVFAKPIVSSFSSLRDTLAHIVAAEWLWLERWNGISPTALPEWAVDCDAQSLRDQLDTIERARRRFFDALDDEGLERTITYRNIAGQEKSYRIVDAVRHVVNHSTYHRGQLATMLRQVGVKPPATDMTAYFDTKGQQQFA